MYYFPLKTRLKKLLKCQKFAQMLQHEFERPRNDDYITDVFDTPAWQEFMGAATFPISRIGLLYCIDAIPAFAAGTLSLKPAEFILLSLPPGQRTKSDNIMLFMLLPNNLAKGAAQKKYYDWAAEFELNDIAKNGSLLGLGCHHVLFILTVLFFISMKTVVQESMV